MSESPERFFELRDQLTVSLKIAEKIKETSDAYSFRFEIPANLAEKLNYRAGQFVTLFLSVGDQHIRRSYSLSTSPAYDTDFQITVKQVPGGLGSNFLAEKVDVHSSLFVTPPQGTFFQPLDKSLGAEYFFFAAGSGITPIFSIMKEILTTDSSAKTHLLFANRDEDHIIYKDALTKLSGQFSGRLMIQHQLSQPKSSSLGSGRCDETLMQNFVRQHKTKGYVQAYICGPEGFMNCAKSALKIEGFAGTQIRTESFASGLTAQGEPPQHQTESEELDGLVIGDPSAPTTKPSRITAILNGERVEVEVDPELSVLENLLNAGQNPPYSCMDGACMACMAKITSGKVVQDDFGILTDENIEAGEALTCQARPASNHLVVDYDSL